MNQEIKIPLSKNKIFLLCFGALSFVALGVWILNDPEKFADSFYRPKNPEFVQIVAILTVAFFGLCGVFAFKKLFDKKDGLIINKNGIIDNSSGTSIGIIKWNDIIGIGTAQVHSQKFIMIQVSNPEYYIALNKNRIAKMAMKANNNKFGSPISISANSLKTSFRDLKALIEREFERYCVEKTHHNTG